MSKIRYVVHCMTHGVESKDYAGKQVLIPKPKEGKKNRLYGGCPMCKKAQAKK